MQYLFAGTCYQTSEETFYCICDDGKVTFRLGLLLRTSVAVVCYDLRTKENRQGVRKGVRSGKIKKVHGVCNETCSRDRKKL
jgi:hypothetical protein